jgi:heterodisulfide reductase subunit A
MVSVGQHENVELLSYSEVEEVAGYVGNFQVKVRKKARYVNEDLCTGCGSCVENCPVQVPDEFDQGLSKRHAIYRPFPQAVPGAFVIDKKMPPCKAACPAHVGAPGYVILTSRGKFLEALQVIKEKLPFPSICGRVCHRPCEKACTRSKIDEPVGIAYIKRFIGDLELKIPARQVPPIRTREEQVAIVGAGPAGLAAAHDLVMMGYHVAVFEAAPALGGMMRFGIPAFRLSREILDREIYDIVELGVKVWRNVTIGRDLTLDDLFARGYRAIFLAVGAQKGRNLGVPGEDLEGVSQAINFLWNMNLGQETQLRGKVVVVGGGNAALDTARSALRVGAREVTILYRRSRAEMPAEPKWEIDETEREGIKFMHLVTPTRFLGRDGKLTAMECMRMELGAPDESGRRRPIPIPGSEFTMDVDHAFLAVGQMVDLSLIAGTVRRPARAEEALEMTPWGTLKVDPITLATSVEGIFSGGDAIVGGGTVIGAIAAGKQAAISIDRYVRGEDLRAGRGERGSQDSNGSGREEYDVVEPTIESIEAKARVPMRYLPFEERVNNFREVELGYTEEMAVEEARRCLSCGVCTECRECVALCERQAIDHTMRDEYVNLDVGTIILATGFSPFDPARAAKFGYGLYDNVLTGLEFERMVHSSGPTGGKILLKDGRVPESVAILHCVGSRDEDYNAYCSRVCCMYSLKLAHLLRENTQAQVYEIYKDLRAFGKGYEEFSRKVEEEGVTFIHGDVSQVVRENGRLMVQCENTFFGQPQHVAVDMVVLGIGMEPRPDAGDLATLFGISRSEDGFLLEKHPKLAPVDTASDGIFVAGTCQGPKDIPDTVAQAGAAAAAALGMIDHGKVAIEPFVPRVAELRCVGCGFCAEVCPYQAIELVEQRPFQMKAQVNETLCKGCGLCVAACRGKALSLRGFSDQQLLAEVEALLAVA